MGMAGKLQVEKTGSIFVQQRAMFQQNGKMISGEAGEHCFFRDFRGAISPPVSWIIHARDVDQAGNSHSLPAENGETGLLREVKGWSESCVKFMVPGHCEFPVFWPDFLEHCGEPQEIVHLPVHEVPCRDKDMGIRGLHLVYNPL